MRNITKGIIGIIAILVLVGTVSGAGIENLTTDVGSTYIHWSWNYNNTSQTVIFVDGQLQFNSTSNEYTLSDLNPREYHSLKLANVTNHTEVYGISQTRTFYPISLFYLLFGLSIMFFLMMILFKMPVLSMIAGTLAFVISIGSFYLSFPMHLQLFSYLSLMISVLCVIWLIMAAFTMIQTGFEEDLGYE